MLIPLSVLYPIFRYKAAFVRNQFLIDSPNSFYCADELAAWKADADHHQFSFSLSPTTLLKYSHTARGTYPQPKKIRDFAKNFLLASQMAFLPLSDQSFELMSSVIFLVIQLGAVELESADSFLKRREVDVNSMCDSSCFDSTGSLVN